MILHCLQVEEKRGHTLVDDEWVGGVVCRETHPYRGEAGHLFQKHLVVLVCRFALPTSGQALAGKQKRRHMLRQVGQRRQRLGKWAQELWSMVG